MSTLHIDNADIITLTKNSLTKHMLTICSLCKKIFTPELINQLSQDSVTMCNTKPPASISSLCTGHSTKLFVSKVRAFVFFRIMMR